MKLSDLIAYRNLLNELRPGNTESVVRDQIGPLLHIVENHNLQFSELTSEITAKYQAVNQSFDQFNLTIDKIHDQLKQLISKEEPEYFSNSYRLYEEAMAIDTNEYILDRTLELSDVAREFIIGRLRLYGDWKHSGMIIRPGKEDWIDYLVGCDPLYLIDQNLELMLPALGKFNEQYQNRIRTYSITESDIEPMLDRIPNQQFSFCLSYYLFNFKPFEIIKGYLTEIYSKLKPGGVLAFTYNNCDLPGGVKLYEHCYMSYTPGILLESLVNSLGYEIIQKYQLDAACTWVEIRKPGELHSLRGGQSLAKLVAKSK